MTAHFTFSTLYTAMASCFLLSGYTFAQSSESVVETTIAKEPEVKTKAPSEQKLEVIQVTANKRAEPSNEVGMGIAVFDGNMMENMGIEKPADLSKVVPGFTAQESGYNTPVYNLRGVGFYSAALAAGPAVTVYLDEVGLPYPAMTTGVGFDLQRVEILKGPQGTLFGQNSTGGAVNYIAAKPTENFEAMVSLGLGNFDTYEQEGFVSGSVSDTVRARIALKGTQKGDWQENSALDTEDLGELDTFQGRILLDWDVTEDFLLSFNVNGWQEKGDTQSAQYVATVTQSKVGSISPFYGLGDQEGNEYDYPQPAEDNTDAAWSDNYDYRKDNSFWQASMRADYYINEDITFTSITAFQEFEGEAITNNDGTEFDIIVSHSAGDIKSFSQELRMGGTSLDYALEWVVGYNFQQDKVNDTQGNIFTESSIGAFIPFDGNDGVTPVATRSTAKSTQEVTTEAIFATVGYHFADDALKLTLGARYSESDRDFEGCSIDANESQALAAVFGSDPDTGCITLDDVTFAPGLIVDNLKEDNTAWRLGLDWKASDDTLVYATVNKGFKAGSYPTIVSSLASQSAAVTQESVLAYELGFKSTLLDGAMQLNSAAFYYDYEDKQLRAKVNIPPFGLLSRLVNIPKSTVQGAELDLMWLPAEGWTVNLGMAYIETEITEFTGYGYDGTLKDLAGNEFAYSPKFQAISAIRYETDLTNNLLGYIGVNASYKSESNGIIDPQPDTTIDSYMLVGLQAGIESNDGDWEAQLYVRNLTDEYYWQSVVEALDTVARITGMPRTYGVKFSYNF